MEGGENMKSNTIVIFIVVVVIAAGAGFFGGTIYQKSQRSQFGQLGGRSQGGSGQFQRRNGKNGGMAVTGEILSHDDTSITVKMLDGSSKIVILSASTSINKQATGSKNDLTAGQRVAVFGSTNSDGSVTAQSVQINPMMRGGFGGGPTPTKPE